MNLRDAEEEAAQLLLEEKRLARFGMKLGPVQAQRLKSLLLLLGWWGESGTMTTRLSRPKRGTSPRRYAAPDPAFIAQVKAESGTRYGTGNLTSQAFADHLQDLGIPGAEIVRRHGEVGMPTHSRMVRTGGILPGRSQGANRARRAEMEGSTLILAPHPFTGNNEVYVGDDGHPLPVAQLYAGPPNDDGTPRVLIGVHHHPAGMSVGDPWENGVTHGANVRSWDDFMTLTRDFPSWARKEMADRIVRAGAMPAPTDPRTGRRRVLKFARIREALRRYAKVDGHVEAHPLVAGFPIEEALRHLANDPKNQEAVRAVAKTALTGKDINGDPADVSASLWSLHDALHEAGHRMAEGHFNWMSAADKVNTDAVTHEAFRREAERWRQEDDNPVITGSRSAWMYSPEWAAHHINRARRAETTPGDGTGQYGPNSPEAAALKRVREYVKKSKKDIAPEQIEESIKRHAYRARLRYLRNHVGVVGYHAGHALSPVYAPLSRRESLHFGDDPEHAYDEEKAARYRRRPKRYLKPRTDFIDALRRIRSSNQEALHKTANRLADKLGLHPTKILNALHDTPTASTPGIAQAVYGPAPPEAVHQAAAWIGLTSNSPGVSVFHFREQGPDSIHRVRHVGSGLELRSRLDRFGIKERVLIPHKKGFDVLIPDRGSRMERAVGEFASATKSVPETSRGFFASVGSQDQATARDKYRGEVVRGEHSLPMSRKDKPVRYSHEAFQDQIAHNESDANARAVYADWIEENAPHTATPDTLHRLRTYQGRMWVGMSPGGNVLAIPTVTKEWLQANPHSNMYHRTSRNRKGQAHSVRQSGKIKTWKTRPDEFRVPWKFGLYENGEVTHRNSHEWLTEDPTVEPTDFPVRNSRRTKPLKYSSGGEHVFLDEFQKDRDNTHLLALADRFEEEGDPRAELLRRHAHNWSVSSDQRLPQGHSPFVMIPPIPPGRDPEGRSFGTDWGDPETPDGANSFDVYPHRGTNTHDYTHVAMRWGRTVLPPGRPLYRANHWGFAEAFTPDEMREMAHKYPAYRDRILTLLNHHFPETPKEVTKLSARAAARMRAILNACS